MYTYLWPCCVHSLFQPHDVQFSFSLNRIDSSRVPLLSSLLLRPSSSSSPWSLALQLKLAVARIIHKCLSELIRAARGCACLKTDRRSWLGSISVLCCLDCETVQVGLIISRTWTHRLTGRVLTLTVCCVNYFRGDGLGHFIDSSQLLSQEAHFGINGSLLLSPS